MKDSFMECQILAAAVFAPVATVKLVMVGEYGGAIFFALWSLLAWGSLWRSIFRGKSFDRPR